MARSQCGPSPPESNCTKRQPVAARSTAIRLSTRVWGALEQNDEWLVQRRYLSDDSIHLVLSDAQGSEPTRRIDDGTEVIALNAA